MSSIAIRELEGLFPSWNSPEVQNGKRKSRVPDRFGQRGEQTSQDMPVRKRRKSKNAGVTMTIKTSADGHEVVPDMLTPPSSASPTSSKSASPSQGQKPLRGVAGKVQGAKVTKRARKTSGAAPQLLVAARPSPRKRSSEVSPATKHQPIPRCTSTIAGLRCETSSSPISSPPSSPALQVSSPDPLTIGARRGDYSKKGIITATSSPFERRSSSSTSTLSKAKEGSNSTLKRSNIGESAERERTATTVRKPRAKSTTAHASRKGAMEGVVNLPRHSMTPAGGAVAQHVPARALPFDGATCPEARPLPLGMPPVWSDSRQALCETCPYYRAYQSSCYTTGGGLKACMFDGYSFHRDYLDADVVIARAGGGLQPDADGNYVQSRETSSSQMGDVLNNIRHQVPVVIIIGKGATHAQVRVPHQYNVVDFYMPTDVFYEKDASGAVIGRYRFERLKPSDTCWSRPALDAGDIEHQTVNLGQLPPPASKTCAQCGVVQEQRYVQGWMCMRATCPAFFKFSDGALPADNDALRYDPRWLKKKTGFTNVTEPYNLKPALHVAFGTREYGAATSVDASRGICCQSCGWCGIRVNWADWSCGSVTCSQFGQKIDLRGTFIPAKELRSWTKSLGTGYALPAHRYKDHTQKIELGNRSWSEFVQGYRMTFIELPGVWGNPAGYLIHMVANRVVNEEPHIGPDALFETLQKTDISLKRRLKHQPQSTGASYTSHYYSNFGELYKFIIAQETTSFEEAPEVIGHCRARMSWAGRLITSLLKDRCGPRIADFDEFNEVLALGYMQGDAICWHDDGEDGVHGTICTMTLGSSALMEFRVHKTIFAGITKSGLFVDKPPIPGCQNYERRAHLWPSHQARVAAARDGNHVNAVLKEIGAEIKTMNSELAAEDKVSSSAFVELEVSHGDMVFFVGSEVQKCYEHTVKHIGGSIPRFAMTGRYIVPMVQEGNTKIEGLPSAKRGENNYNGPPANY